MQIAKPAELQHNLYQHDFLAWEGQGHKTRVGLRKWTMHVGVHIVCNQEKKEHGGSHRVGAAPRENNKI